jgi:DNA-binding LacI/PurR family transcriptional regulator
MKSKVDAVKDRIIEFLNDHPEIKTLPTQEKMEAQFGAKRGTLREALRKLEQEKLIEGKQGSVYRVIRDTDPLAINRKAFGLIMPSSGGIFEIIATKLRVLCKEKDYTLDWGRHEKPQAVLENTPQSAALEALRYINANVEGVFFIPFEHHPKYVEENIRIAQLLNEAAIPVILIDRALSPLPRQCDFDLVCLDNFHAGMLLAEHLIRHGQTDVLFFKRDNSAPTVDARIDGVREEFYNKKISLPDTWIRTGDPDRAADVVPICITHRFGTVICANDETAAAFIKTARDGKYAIPEQIRVVGFDGLPFPFGQDPMLTTIVQPTTDIAYVALELMRRRLDSIRRPIIRALLPPQLRLGRTCGTALRQDTSVKVPAKKR